MSLEWLPASVTPLSLFNLGAFTVELVVAQALFAVRWLPRPPFGRAIAAATGMLLCMLACLIALDGVQALYLRHMIRFGMLFLASMIALRYVYRCEVRVAAQIGVCGYALQHIAAALVEIGHLGRAMLPLELARTWAFGELMRIVLFAVVYGAFAWWYIRRFDVLGVRLSPGGLGFLVVSVLLVTIGLSSFAYTDEHAAATLFAMRAVSVLTCVMILLVFAELARNQRLSDELAFVRRMNDLRTNYYELLKDTIETTNVRYHDLKHQVARLRSTVDGGAEGAQASHAVLDEIAESVGTYDNIAKTGNAALDVVLTQKSLECARKSIHFTYMVDAGCLERVSDYNIYSLFGNALDNAIEAVERLDDEERRVVKLTGVTRGGFVNIHVTNYYDQVKRGGDGELVTTKADAVSHGYGVKSIRMIVEQLGGDMTITAQDGIFDLNIVLPKVG